MELTKGFITERGNQPNGPHMVVPFSHDNYAVGSAFSTALLVCYLKACNHVTGFLPQKQPAGFYSKVLIHNDFIIMILGRSAEKIGGKSLQCRALHTKGICRVEAKGNPPGYSTPALDADHTLARIYCFTENDGFD